MYVFTPYLLSMDIGQDWLFIFTTPLKDSPDDQQALEEILELERILIKMNVRHRKLYRGEQIDCLALALKGWI